MKYTFNLQSTSKTCRKDVLHPIISQLDNDKKVKHPNLTDEQDRAPVIIVYVLKSSF